MSNIVLTENNSLTAKPFTTSKIIADGLNLKHHTITKVIRNFESDFDFGDGLIGFNIHAATHASGKKYEKTYNLSETTGNPFIHLFKKFKGCPGVQNQTCKSILFNG